MPDDAGPRRKPSAGDGAAHVLSQRDDVDESGVKLSGTAEVTELSEVLGDASLTGNALAVGELLPLIDMAAGRCAALHANAANIVTGSFDSIRAYAQVFHGDVVTARAQVVSVGSRSMLIRVDAFREPSRVIEMLNDSSESSRILVLR